MPPTASPKPSSGIKWHEVTWYSKLGAIILFLIVVPALCFYIGIQYASVRPNITSQESNSNPTPAANTKVQNFVSLKISPDISLNLPTEYELQTSNIPTEWYARSKSEYTVYGVEFPLLDITQDEGKSKAQLCGECGGVYATSTDMCSEPTDVRQVLLKQAGAYSWCTTFESDNNPDTGNYNFENILLSNAQKTYKIRWELGAARQTLSPDSLLSSLK